MSDIWSFLFPSLFFSLELMSLRMADDPRNDSASYDILRLYDVREQESRNKSAVPFLIVPGHRTGVISALHIDPTCRFLISTAGNRGWEGGTTEVLLGYEINVPS